jgi:hypothetical protein
VVAKADTCVGVVITAAETENPGPSEPIPERRDEQNILFAICLTIVIATLFTFGVGVGIWRVIYHVFPAVLLLIGWISGKLAASPIVRWRLAVLLVPISTVALVVNEIAKPYP